MLDFAARNRLTFDSSDYSINTITGVVPLKTSEMRAILGPELFNTRASWFWFTLNEHAGPFQFPKAKRPTTV